MEAQAFLVFAPAASEDVPAQLPRNALDLAFRMPHTNCTIVRAVLAENGFAEARRAAATCHADARQVHPHSSLFNVQWTGAGIRPYLLQHVAPFQRINHFPRSSEITRKDRLYRNMVRMQRLRGARAFNFVPRTFVLPQARAHWCRKHPSPAGPCRLPGRVAPRRPARLHCQASRVVPVRCHTACMCPRC